ncbi:hypothetical protein ACQKND_09220 [Viridibacillus arvi]|uniref:hypothetical protein n=1 Tax=Viridibacillus arvi TaxID=263475 RepID=UPI003CFBE4CD
MDNQNHTSAAALINAPHPSFFYINRNNKLCITETDWIDPIDLKKCCSIDSNGNWHSS